MPIIKKLSSQKKTNKAAKHVMYEGSETNIGNNSEILQCGEDVEFQFKITFSADGAMSNENYYYREVVKPFNVTILPSALVTKWDVVPSESSDKNFLVLDITNCSQNEMDLMYADSKKLVIETCDVCRIPLPIDR